MVNALRFGHTCIIPILLLEEEHAIALSMTVADFAPGLGLLRFETSI